MKRARAALMLTFVAVTAPACRTKSSEATTLSSSPAPVPNSLVAARPFHLDVPPHYDATKPAPLLLALHGYRAGSEAVAGARWELTASAAAHGAFVARPEGTQNAKGYRFWNATDACCNFEDTPVDDVAYLTAVIDDVSARYKIDPRRIWVAGVSNGGFMAHRLACERADKVSAIVSYGGSTWADAARCPQSTPVSVLEVHGAEDTVILYAGGSIRDAGYPSVEGTVAASAAKDGCTGALVASGTKSGFDEERPAVATEVARWAGCPAGVDVERWRLPGAPHVPSLSHAGGEAIVEWLERHPKG